MTFEQVKIGATFKMNSTRWVKKSSRTAHVLGTPDRWFYFSPSEIIRR